MIFITGAASSGKTSAIKALKEKLPADKYDIHDIDEADKWSDDYESWRDAKIEHWLKQSIKNRERGVETILCGIIYPEHVTKSPAYAKASPVRFILLDTSPEELERRFYAKMEAWLGRQKEISKELRDEMASSTNSDVIETNGVALEGVVAEIINSLV